jgi:peptide/nickel transport system permease protein
VTLALVVAVGPLVYPIDPAAINLLDAVSPPSLAHPLGTDESGRDVLARLIEGGRITLTVGLAAGLVALAAGTAVGALAASRRVWIGTFAGGLLDASQAVPTFFLLLAIMTLFEGSTVTVVLAIGLTAWMGIARVVRAETMSLRERDFVAASESLGQTRWGAFRLHVLPHLSPTLTAAAGVGVAHAILTESALSFLGLGIEPPRATWGNLLTGAQQHLAGAPFLAVYPGVLIVLTVLGCNALAEALTRSSSRAGA